MNLPEKYMLCNLRSVVRVSKGFILIVLCVLTICASAELQATRLTQDTRPAELKSVDTELNKTYQKIMKLLPAEAKKQLILSQRKWLEFRDLDCQWSFSAEPLDCQIERTENRTHELQETLFSTVNGEYRTVE